MLPVITIIGRPNVGKSTLFNRLTQTRAALVADMPGVTRDRQYGEGEFKQQSFIVVDTGGINEPDESGITQMREHQVDQAIVEADSILFMVDAKTGLVLADQAIADRLRALNKPVVLLVNKVDREEATALTGDFYQLGLGKPKPIAAKSGRGVDTVIAELLETFPEEKEALVEAPLEPEEERVGIAVIGRPNVGKSTLVNCMLGEDRVVVFDQPGTTRDSIFIPFDRRDKHYTLIDTAGIRRRARIQEVIEKFSIIKTMQAIEKARVVIVVINAQDNLSEQDLRLIGLVLNMGKALVIAFNKWDGLSEYQREQFKKSADRRLRFVTFVRRYTISALHGSGVGKLYHAIDEAHASATRNFSTAELTRTLEKAVEEHQPPLVKGRRIKLRYAHCGGHDPLLIVIHGKQVAVLPGSYQRYLASYFRSKFDLIGVPVIVKFKADVNPYQV